MAKSSLQGLVVVLIPNLYDKVINSSDGSPAGPTSPLTTEPQDLWPAATTMTIVSIAVQQHHWLPAAAGLTKSWL